MITSKIPDRPWAKIGVDLFEHNKTHYLLSVDYHSKWIAKLDNQSSKNTITYLQSQFSRYGIPDQLVSDNGPQFISAEFAEFSKKYGFTHITSSPHYPQANGEAERAVQTLKGLLTKAKDPYKALMNYGNTPLEEINQSPAQLMMGRRLKTSLPTAAPLLKSRASDEVRRILKKQKEKQKQYYDKRTGKELPPLQPGETVQMKHGEKWIKAKVLHKPWYHRLATQSCDNKIWTCK
jgi:transposase InsO family protein